MLAQLLHVLDRNPGEAIHAPEVLAVFAHDQIPALLSVPDGHPELTLDVHQGTGAAFQVTRRKILECGLHRRADCR